MPCASIQPPIRRRCISQSICIMADSRRSTRPRRFYECFVPGCECCVPPERRTKPILHSGDPYLDPDAWSEEAALRAKQERVKQKLEAGLPLEEEEVLAAGWTKQVDFPANWTVEQISEWDQHVEAWQAATSAPSSSAGSDRQPPALPPSWSTTGLFRTWMCRRHRRPLIVRADRASSAGLRGFRRPEIMRSLQRDDLFRAFPLVQQLSVHAAIETSPKYSI